MSLLLEVLRQPALIKDFDGATWNRFLSELRSQQLCARLSYIFEDRGLIDACPSPVWTELRAQRYRVEYIQSQARLEVHKVRKALSETGIPVILLKGAAYAAMNLPLSRGRLFSDLDIMVPRQALERAETAFMAAGWKTEKIAPYDQRYYRRWMHELPPLRHPAREIELDVHHAILPLTGRLKPNVELLWADSVAMQDSPFRTLGPQDMLLHSAAHLLQDGAIEGGLGGLLDLHDLIIQYQDEPGWWEDLIDRARQLDLGRPLYYGLHFTKTMLGSPIPDDISRAAAQFAPRLIGDALMKAWVPRLLTPHYPRPRPPTIPATMLYLRSHWLKMPPALLTKHLLTKALMRSQPTKSGGTRLA